MSREQTHTAIILKKQALGEADEIVTAFSQSSGKIRFLAKSVKLPKSKLQHALQVPFEVQITLAGSGGLPTVISSSILQSFGNIRINPKAGRGAFYALETVLKSTADGQKNPLLFQALKFFLETLARPHLSARLANVALLKFKIQALSVLGLAVSSPKEQESGGATLGFSNSLGGFIQHLPEYPAVSAAGMNGARISFPQGLIPCGEGAGFIQKACLDFKPVSQQAMSLFLNLNRPTRPDQAEVYVQSSGAEELQNLLSGFLEYHLEREIKSHKFMAL